VGSMEGLFVAGGSFLGSLSVILLALRFLNGRINKVEDKVVLRDHCIDRHNEIKDNFDRGEKKFDEISRILREQGEMLSRIDERTEFLARKNGLEG